LKSTGRVVQLAGTDSTPGDRLSFGKELLARNVPFTRLLFAPNNDLFRDSGAIAARFRKQA